MAEVVKELEEMQLQYGEEKEQLVQAKREALAQQRLQHDIGGLTETVVSEHRYHYSSCMKYIVEQALAYQALCRL